MTSILNEPKKIVWKKICLFLPPMRGIHLGTQVHF